MTATRRLPVSDAELAVIAEALREALAAELLSPGSQSTARELLDRVDAKLPDALDEHPAGASTGRLLAGDEIVRLLLAHEDVHGWAALSNEQIADELSWKPAGTSVRELLDELRRAGWLTARGSGPERRFELTRKGRGRARDLAHAGSAPDSQARQRTRRAAGPHLRRQHAMRDHLQRRRQRAYPGCLASPDRPGRRPFEQHRAV
jgi:DNA-binding PadR family transcriptional regulator